MNSIIKNFQFTDLNVAIEESFLYYKWLFLDFPGNLNDNK
jgi:hypothetical protein